MTPPGLFVSFEGIDGAGKSSHIEALAQAFTAHGRTVTLTREPGGTVLAEKLRTLVLNDPMDALTEALLIFAARRDHVLNVIAPALKKGDVVLCDRFTDASFAYQGAGRGFDLDVLSKLELWSQSVPALRSEMEGENDVKKPSQHVLQPHLTLWFDLNPAVAAQRLATARVPDKFESQPQAFFEKVARGYAARAAQAPERFVRIDAELARPQVWAQIMAVLARRGWLPGANT